MKRFVLASLLLLFSVTVTAQSGTPLTPDQVAVVVADDLVQVQQSPVLVMQNQYDVVIDEIANKDYEVPRSATNFYANEVGTALSLRATPVQPDIPVPWYMATSFQNNNVKTDNTARQIRIVASSSGGLSGRCLFQ